MKKFGWAVIGCGNIARGVAGEIIGSENGRIVSAWNRTESKAVEFCEIYGGKPCRSIEEAVTAEGVDGAYVATTHDKHAEFTKICIENGIPVVCEKPFAVNLKEAEEVFSYAKKKNVYVSEAMWTWHNKTANVVRNWVKNGRLGEIKGVFASYAWPMINDGNYNKRLTEPSLIGGALLDIGIYPVRYVYEIFGMPYRITCRGDVVGGVDHNEKIEMDYGSFKAEITVSIRSDEGEYFIVEGSEGRIDVPLFHMAREATLSGRFNEKFNDGEKYLYGTQMRNAAEEISAGKKESAFCPEKNTLDTMRLLDECRRQMGVVYPSEK